MIAAMLAPILVFVLIVAVVVKAVYFRRPLDRILVIVVGFLAGGLAIVLLAVIPAATLWIVGAAMAEPGRDSVSFAGWLIYIAWIVLYFGGFIALFGLVPAILIIVFAELKAIRRLMFYCLAGVSVVLLGRFGYWLWLGPPPGFWDLGLTNWPLLFGSGLLSGFVYWLVAGRKAGNSPPTPEVELPHSAS